MKQKTILILTAAILAVMIFFPSCLSIDPSSIRDTEIKEVTLEELAKLFEEEESSEEGLTLEELLVEEGVDPETITQIEKSLVETSEGDDSLKETGEEENTEEEVYEPAAEKVELEGASVLSDGVLMPIDEWRDAQEITEESAMMKPLDFVEAADLPIEATGKVIEAAEEIKVSSPKTEEEPYQPAVTVVSSTASDELDILSEYEKFLEEYGDYTEAESDIVEESTINELFAVPAAPVFTSAPERTLVPVEAAAETSIEPDSISSNVVKPESSSEEDWIEVPVETPETDTTEEKEESQNFFERLWNKVKTFFINLWSDIKNWISVVSPPKEKEVKE